MSDMNFIDSLNDFGLTRQEGSIYSALLNHGEMTGYEVAKDTGISRSNVYAALTALVEKGAAYLVQGEATKYRPIEISRFTENRISELKKTALWLEKHAPRKVISCDGYITIIGAKNIKNKIRQMLAENGADPDVKDMMGMSAYNYAVLFKKQKLVEILTPYHKAL